MRSTWGLFETLKVQSQRSLKTHLTSHKQRTKTLVNFKLSYFLIISTQSSSFAALTYCINIDTSWLLQFWQVGGVLQNSFNTLEKILIKHFTSSRHTPFPSHFCFQAFIISQQKQLTKQRNCSFVFSRNLDENEENTKELPQDE